MTEPRHINPPAMLQPLAWFVLALLSFICILLTPWLGTIAWILEKLHLPGCSLVSPFSTRATSTIGLGACLFPIGIFAPIILVQALSLLIGFVLLTIGCHAPIRPDSDGRLKIRIFGGSIEVKLH